MSLPAAQLRLPPLLSGPDGDALRALERYYRPGPSSTGFTGRWFDTWDPDGRRSENADRFTDTDLTAVTHLSVAVPSRATLEPKLGGWRAGPTPACARSCRSRNGALPADPVLPRAESTGYGSKNW